MMDWRGVGICLMGMIAVASAQCGSDVFTPMVNKHVSGGTKDTSGITTLAACQTACSSDRACLSIDVTTTPFACYFLSDPQMPVTASTGVTHYNITRKCLSSTTACTYHDYGAYRFTTAPTASPVTFDNCANSCNIESACLAFASSTALGCQKATTVAMLNSMSVSSTSKMMLKGSCTATCVNTWTKAVDTSASGGTLTLTSTTEALCKADCVARSTCTRVDLDGSNNCYIHIGTPAVKSSPGITQYTLTRCTDTQVSTTVAAGCQIMWTNSANIHSPNGDLKATLITATACQAGCLSLSGCLGVDVKGTQCWFHTNAAVFSTKAVEAGVTQYVLDRCVGQTTTASCIPTFGITASRSSPSGVRQASANTLELCKTACVDDTACVAFDYDTTQTTPSCWIHTMLTNLDQQRSTTGITQYKIIDRCPGVCVTTWDPIVNNHGLGGTANSANTLALCQAACETNSACISLDWTTSNTCFLFTAAGYTREDVAGVTHYRIQRCSTACEPTYVKTSDRSSPNGFSVASITTEAGCKTACANNASCLAFDYNTVNPPKCWLHSSQTNLNDKRSTPNINQYILTSRCPTTCVDSWTTKSNMHGLGGTSVAVNTLAACQNECSTRSNCLAVDFTSSNACFIFTATGYTQEAMTGVNHYIRNKCSTVTTVAPPASTTRSGCQVVWTNYTNMGSAGAMKETGFNSLDACLNGCFALGGCVAVDYTKSVTPNECWFHMTSLSTRRADTGVTQYVLDRCFKGTTAPGCIIAWANKTDTKSIGATDRGVMTEDNCLTTCIGDSNCVAVDYDTSSSKCWLHMQASNIQATVAASGIKQFVLDRCASTGTTRMPGCGTATTTKYTNMHTNNGSPRPEYTSQESCRDACAADTTCLAYDYDRNSGVTACWFHNTLETRLSQTGTDYYVIVNRCPGQTQQCPLFVESSDMHAAGGIQQSTLNTQNTCMTGCLNNANCNGYDFDATNNGCYFFFQETATSALKPQTGVTHYELKCRAGETVPPVATTTGSGVQTTSSACEVSWTIFVENRGLGGIQQTNIRTLSECRAQCEATPACLAIDYVPSLSTCWFFTSAYNRVPIDQGDPIINHHILQRCGRFFYNMLYSQDQG